MKDTDKERIIEDLLFEAMVGYLDSVLVIENGIKRHIGKGGFLSFKNGEWIFPELVYNKSVLPYFTTVTKIKDSLVAFNLPTLSSRLKRIISWQRSI